MELIKINNLNKIYKKGTIETRALDNVNVKINEKEFVAVVGPSGSGKSTFLHMIGGVDKPTSGDIYIENKKISDLKEKELAIYRRRNIGFIFQSYNLIPVLNVEENISMPVLLDNKEEVDDIEELLDFLGLTMKRFNLPSELSGGQQQRVAIGRALAYKPGIILADEPTGNLDRKSGKDIIDLLKFSAKKYHQTLIIITHDLEIASQADRVLYIEDGVMTENEVDK